jgi:hypothetical protein
MTVTGPSSATHRNVRPGTVRNPERFTDVSTWSVLLVVEALRQLAPWHGVRSVTHRARTDTELNFHAERSPSMRASSSASRVRPIRVAAGLTGYIALAAFMVTLLTPSGPLAVVTGTVTVILLISTYVLDTWARRRVLRSRRSPTSIVDTAAASTEHAPLAPDVDKPHLTHV